MFAATEAEADGLTAVGLGIGVGVTEAVLWTLGSVLGADAGRLRKSMITASEAPTATAMIPITNSQSRR